MHTEILSVIDADRDAMLALTRQLVAMPTENPPGRGYRACMDVLAEYLTELGFEPEILEIPASGETTTYPRYALRCFHGTGERTLYFHGHYDVVPATGEAQFLPTVRRGNLFGRGASDMKSGLAAMIHAMKALRDCNAPLDGRIGLMIVPDEETGGVLGSASLARMGVLGQDGIGMLTPEPTSGVIWNANRGAVTLRVTVHGTSAHVGLQHQGVNAFDRMLVVARALTKLKQEVEARETRFAIDPPAARKSILMMGGRCEGGTNFNLVPNRIAFTVDRRINPEERLDEEKQRILDVLERVRKDGIDLEVEMLQEGAASGVSEEEPVARALADSVRRVTGRRAVFAMCPGLLEIRFYAQRGIPAFAYGPGLLSVSHGPHEFVKIKEIARCAGIYALTAIAALE